MRKAVSYDRNDWNYHYGLAIALAANDLNPIPEARRAVRLNPRSPLTRSELTAFQTASPQDWTQVTRAGLVQTTYAYDETMAANKLTATDVNSFNDNAEKTVVVYDGLGRKVENRQSCGVVDHMSWFCNPLVG